MLTQEVNASDSPVTDRAPGVFHASFGNAPVTLRSSNSLPPLPRIVPSVDTIELPVSSRRGLVVTPPSLGPRPGDMMRELAVNPRNVGELGALKDLANPRPLTKEVLRWQYLEHPMREHVRMFGVERDHALVAATVRLPSHVFVGERKHLVYFQADSMVHPGHRRQGLMRALYAYARRALDPEAILLSKGATPQIYELLLSLGYRPMSPATYLVTYPSPARWAANKLGVLPPSNRPITLPSAHADSFQVCGSFGAEWNDFFEEVRPAFGGIYDRSAAWMRWRYIDVPHRTYARFLYRKHGKIAGLLVMNREGPMARIVDIVWRPGQTSDLKAMLACARDAADAAGIVRLACFATHAELRRTLLDSSYIDRGETPRFSVLTSPELMSRIPDLGGYHVVDGDGDTEMS